MSKETFTNIYDTEKFSFVIGVTEGYFHDNENANIDFIYLVDQVANEVEQQTGIYIAFNIIPSTTVYKKEWGCPEGGEKTYNLSAIRNPQFNKDAVQWIVACNLIVDKLQLILTQSTITSEITRIIMRYGCLK